MDEINFEGRAVILGNLDIELYLNYLQFKKLKDVKLTGKLEDFHETGMDRSFSFYYENFNDLGDGINVDYNHDKQHYDIKINDNAYDLTNGRGEWGTRYGMGEKIKISLSKCPWPTEEQKRAIEEEWEE
ncbi:MAG: hypothetical protein GOV02_03765 [Candidatus Aenigmarchaeota archaeon]|nr:hypothetical protein [Candidatus Aenigmarchaeota archaeon]